MRSIEALNQLGRDDFVRLVGPVFEDSPWIAEAAWPKRPFQSLDQLHQELCSTVKNATEAKRLSLIRAHPDLVTRMKLPSESQHEQASAGLMNLTADDIAQFDSLNQSYRKKFDFPFVICARLNNKDTILDGFRARLQNNREAEIGAALEEIYKIALLRLKDIIQE